MMENEYAPIPDEINAISKAVDEMNPVFDAQVLTYLKLTNIRLGMLINFNSPVLKRGIKRLDYLGGSLSARITAPFFVPAFDLPA